MAARKDAMPLVIHDDFNCPFWALASERAALEALDDLAELLATGATEPPS